MRCLLRGGGGAPDLPMWRAPNAAVGGGRAAPARARVPAAAAARPLRARRCRAHASAAPEGPAPAALERFDVDGADAGVRLAATAAGEQQDGRDARSRSCPFHFLSLRAGKACERAAVLLVHGSFHAAWAWEDYVLGALAAEGRRAVAYSLRGQAGSSACASTPTLEEHTADLAKVAQAVTERSGGVPPVVVGHSFGGLVVQQYASGAVEHPHASAYALAASVPPTGNKAMIGRFFRRDPLASLRLTWAFAAGGAKRDASQCRETFFCDTTDEAVVEQAMARMQGAPPLLDLKRLDAESLPIGSPADREAAFAVFGAVGDNIVDKEGVEEAARFYGAGAPRWLKGGHDVMLDVSKEAFVKDLLEWMDELHV